MFQLLKINSFRHFVIAQMILKLGKKISWLAIGWFVYQLTGASTAIGTVITAATIAPLVSSIFVGGILDQYSRRKIMVMENLLRGSFILLIPVLYWFGHLSLLMIMIVLFINGLLSSFTSIGSSAILPSFVEEEDLQSANAIITMTGQVGYLIGPAIGGFLVAWFGATFTLFIDAIIFFLASFLYFLIPNRIFQNGVLNKSIILPFKERIVSFGKDIVEGFAFLVKHKELIMLSFVTLVFNFTYAPLEPVFPLFVGEYLKEGPEILGMIWTFFAVGALLGSFLWTHFKPAISYSYSLGAVIILWGLSPLTFSLVSHAYLVYLIMFVGGIVYAPYNIVSPTLEQKLVPNHLRGRIIGVIGLIAGIGFPIGAYIGGILGDAIGANHTIFLSGLFTVMLGIVVFLHPALRFKEVKKLQE